jgi:hypothetical protein
MINNMKEKLNMYISFPVTLTPKEKEKEKEPEKEKEKKPGKEKEKEKGKEKVIHGQRRSGWKK